MPLLQKSKDQAKYLNVRFQIDKFDQKIVDLFSTSPIAYIILLSLKNKKKKTNMKQEENACAYCKLKVIKNTVLTCSIRDMIRK